ncbi:hypothetical protein [Agromyces sp. SYSU T00194]|uniref:hypothetical protein n=1 Tax=Agromyces chitinivorans TaxID=3158560 RepID=UPI0033961F49
MSYVHLTDGVPDEFGSPPRLSLVDGGWLDLRTLDPAKLAAAGWYPLVRTPRPDDTATTTWDRGHEFDGSQVTVTWTEVPKTQEQLDDEANRATLDAARLELDRALALTAPDELAALQAAQFATEGITDGSPWRQPAGVHDAYPLDAIVTHAGTEWMSLVAANTWEPGVSGWRESVEAPEWVQPTGEHDAYNTGDRVTFNGAVYESTRDGNVWSPDVLPSGWTLIP